VNYSLEDDELRRGFILTCQSHPLTGHVKVDFDQDN
jgi:ring-1,2-phenylacetyl-CoA epoxidase subunit PaaE